MKYSHRGVLTQCIGATAILCLGLAACDRVPTDRHDAPSIVGTWMVKVPDAPFPMHMFIFHSDGTVIQSNPDAGDPNTSDSNAMGAWVADHDEIRGKIVEVTADRTTRAFATRGEISFVLKVAGDALSGTASAVFYDAGGQKLRGPLQSAMEGQRVLPQ